MPYSPRRFEPLTFSDATTRFRDEGDTPRAYLERCLEVIGDREPVVKAWVALNVPGAREAADASTERYRRGHAVSPIDGMPIGTRI
jgi:Asp-tRNA(Asn)/Glu-tRNA(Gln) amidotransferase A subunit family amidase